MHNIIHLCVLLTQYQYLIQHFKIISKNRLSSKPLGFNVDAADFLNWHQSFS